MKDLPLHILQHVNDRLRKGRKVEQLHSNVTCRSSRRKRSSASSSSSSDSCTSCSSSASSGSTALASPSQPSPVTGTKRMRAWRSAQQNLKECRPLTQHFCCHSSSCSLCARVRIEERSKLLLKVFKSMPCQSKIKTGPQKCLEIALQLRTVQSGRGLTAALR